MGMRIEGGDSAKDCAERRLLGGTRWRQQWAGGFNTQCSNRVGGGPGVVMLGGARFRPCPENEALTRW